jgi:succinate dehydrogenase / fumarate reductase cytochrome b subunit
MSLNTVAFYLHRITGVILAIYLCMHLLFIGTVKTGEYASLIKITLSKEFLPFDLLLFLIGIYHGVNGVRLIIHEFGLLYRYRKALLYATPIITLIIWIFVCLEVIK